MLFASLFAAIFASFVAAAASGAITIVHRYIDHHRVLHEVGIRGGEVNQIITERDV